MNYNFEKRINRNFRNNIRGVSDQSPFSNNSSVPVNTDFLPRGRSLGHGNKQSYNPITNVVYPTEKKSALMTSSREIMRASNDTYGRAQPNLVNPGLDSRQYMNQNRNYAGNQFQKNENRQFSNNNLNEFQREVHLKYEAYKLKKDA